MKPMKPIDKKRQNGAVIWDDFRSFVQKAKMNCAEYVCYGWPGLTSQSKESEEFLSSLVWDEKDSPVNHIEVWWKPGANEGYYAYVFVVRERGTHKEVAMGKFWQIGEAENFVRLATRWFYDDHTSEEQLIQQSHAALVGLGSIKVK